MLTPKRLLLLCALALATLYSVLFQKEQIMHIIYQEKYFLLAFIPLLTAVFVLKFLLRAKKLFLFIPQQFSLKLSLLFFLGFFVYDYYAFNGILGAISQWFFYWLMGVFGVLFIEFLNLFKNYRLHATK